MPRGIIAGMQLPGGESFISLTFFAPLTACDAVACQSGIIGDFIDVSHTVSLNLVYLPIGCFARSVALDAAS